MNSASIVIAALNAFWQGTAIVAVAALALRLFKRVNAATACTVWTVAFATVALLPAVNLVAQRSVVEKVPARFVTPRVAFALHVGNRTSQKSARRSMLRPQWPIPRVEVLSTQSRTLHPSVPSRVAMSLPHWNVQATLLAFAAATSSLAGKVGATLIVAWALVASILLMALLRDYVALRRLKRLATPLERAVLERAPRHAGTRRIRVCTSERVRVPCAAGFLHPMVLLPEPLVDGLSDEDLLRIVLHEIGHLQRFDDWLHAGERVLRAIFFFQPALWYVGSRIAFERELACDDRVLAATGEPIRYAECLTNIVERHVRGRRRFAAVPGFLIGRNQVVGRIARLVDRGRNGSVRVPRTAGLAACAAFALAVGIMLPLQVPLLAACTDGARAASHFVSGALHHRLASRAKRKVQIAAHLPHGIVLAAVTQRHTHCMHAANAQFVALHAVPPTRARAAHTHTVARRHSARRGAASSAAASAIARAESPTAAAAVDSAALGEAAVSYAVMTTRRVPSPRSSDLLDALSAAGMHPSVDELIELHDHGVTADLLYAIADSGIAQPAVGDIIASADRGITRPLLIAAVQAFGPSIPLHDITSLRDAGVTPAYLDALVPLKPRGFSVIDTVALAQNGVTPDYIVALRGAGYPRLDARALVQLHDNGVDARFLRSLAQHGLRDLPLGRIIELHGSGENS